MKVYKFRSLNSCQDLERIEQILEDGFWCNDFLSFNDMNEGVYKHTFELSKETIDHIFNEKYKYKICSFSKEEALKSELMWGHYANAGKGVAIEIEVDDEKLVEVSYEQNELNDNITVEKLLSTKSKSWDYEHEIRYLAKDQENPICKIGTITKVYFGTPYETLTNYDYILEKNKPLKEYLKYKNKLTQLLACSGIAFENFNFKNLEVNQ